MHLELLEDRTVPTTFLVNTTQDVLGHSNGLESLRQAILDSNSAPQTGTPNVITFDFSANDPNHFYYKNDGVAGQVSLAQKTNTTAASDSQIGDIDPDWAHSWWTITPTSVLPAITAPVIIDGYSQLGASANTLADGDNAVLNVQIDGSLLPSDTSSLNIPDLGPYPNIGVPVLTVSGGGSTIEGLNINGILANNGQGIWLIDNGGNHITGNFIGTDISGTLAPNGLPNYSVTAHGPSYGIQISDGSSNNVIGTDGDGVNDPAERNVISANYVGVSLRGYVRETNQPGAQLSHDNVIAGNFIGTDRTGTKALGNWTGISTLGQAYGDRIGTNGTDVDSAGEGNIIAASWDGIMLGAGYYSATSGSHDYVVAGNRIGLGINGQPLGNTIGIGAGLGFYNAQIGGSAPVMWNTIANSTGPGIWITDVREIAYNIDIEGNSIYNNGNLGIDIGGSNFPSYDPVLLNDSAGHSGPNFDQDFPVLLSATPSATGTVIQGTLHSNPQSSYVIRFYANANQDASGYGQGQSYLGSLTVQTDANGNATFSSSLFALPAGEYYLSATATDANGNTSEFCKDLLAPASLTATGVTFTATANTSFTGTVASFTPANLVGGAGSYTAVISWGDGQTSTGIIAANGGGFIVEGSHTYAAAGTYAVTVQITDGSGAVAPVTANSVGQVSSLGQGIAAHQTATIGFWQNKNGVALLDSLGVGPDSTALGNWLATTLPNLYGAGAGANDLAGKTNAQVVGYYQTIFSTHGQKLAAQVMTTSLNVYATTLSLGGNTAEKYGFNVTAAGLGAATYNVASSGKAFGVADNTVLNVDQVLWAANQRTVNGVLYGGDASLQDAANLVFTGINQAGDI